MARSERILAYDALRVFAIVTVVGIHTLMPYRTALPPDAPVRVFDDLLHYAVPLFVFISGVFAWGRPLAEEPGAYRSFLARRAGVIALPFVAWSAFYFALLVLTEGAPSFGRSAGLLVTGHTWYHLYFIPMLLVFYLLTPVASRLMRISPELLVAACYLFRIVFGAVFAASLGKVFGSLGWQFATHLATHLPHMALGAWFAVRYDVLPGWFKRLWPVWLALGTAVLIGASLGLHAEWPIAARRFVYPLGMALQVLGMALGARAGEPALEESERARRWVLRAAPLAFGVYFVHPLFLLGVNRVVALAGAKSLWMHAWFPVAVFVGVTIASFATAAALARLRGVCRLIGLNEPLRTSSARVPG